MNRLFTATVVAALLVTACSSAGVVETQAPTPTVAPAPTAAPSPSPAPSPTPDPTVALGFLPGTKASPRPLDIAVDDKLTFFPNVITVAEGETVTFAIKNIGKAAHEFMLGPTADAMADKEGTPEVADILAGGTKSLTFTFDGPGPFAFTCHEPGHFEAGMIGYIIVVGPDVPSLGTASLPRLVGVGMNDGLQFLPADISVAKGETVTFLVSNLGNVTHEIAVGPADKVDADEIDGTIVKEADEMGAHHVKTLTYTFDAAGPYAFACHMPGHFEAGMRGTVTLR